MMKNNIELITNSFSKSKETILSNLSNQKFIESINDAADLLVETYSLGGKVLLAGNGGSAADCQHICAELVGRLNFDRNPLPAIALTTNTSNLTCISNDYGYSNVFLRQLDALADKNDSLIVYTTSGTSSNILKLLENAKDKVKSVISLTGKNVTQLQKLSDVVISVESDQTTKIQEIHAIAGHVLCECIEENIFNKS